MMSTTATAATAADSHAGAAEGHPVVRRRIDQISTGANSSAG